jgi:spore coat polysaccharide biosynthesis protein SpsF
VTNGTPLTFKIKKMTIIKTDTQNAIVIIQARFNSSRLPGKALIDLAGKPLLAHVIERAKTIEGVSKVILATGGSKENYKLIELAKSLKIETFTGSEDNVLERYYMVSEKYKSNFIIRITGDNPFTDSFYGSKALEIAKETDADLCSIKNIPLGTAVEIIKKTALDKAYSLSNKPYHFEHVTPYIKENSESFNIIRHEVDFKNPFTDLRLTVDTEEDYKLAKIIFEKLFKDKYFSIESVIKFLLENKHLVDINKNMEQRPMTFSSKS